MILSILICSLGDRNVQLGSLLEDLSLQIIGSNACSDVEVLVEIDNREITTGEKRNVLLRRALGEWICFIDDDDEVSSDYLSLILGALKSNPDAVGFEGCMTTNGKNRVHWKISKDLPYIASVKSDGKTEYLRFNNQLSPVRRNIALTIRFKHINHGEDYDYALRLKESGLIKTETYIPKELYHYKFKTK